MSKTRRGIANRAIIKFNLEGEGRKGEIECQIKSITVEFDFDEITNIGWFLFMQEIVGDGNDFELNALFDLLLMKWF